MVKNFNELRDKMSPERQRRNAAEARRMLLEMTPQPSPASVAQIVAQEIVAAAKKYTHEMREALKQGEDRWPVWEAWEMAIRERIALALDAARRDGARETWEAAATILQRGSDEPMTGTDETVHLAEAGVKITLGILAIEFRARAGALDMEAPHDAQ